MTALLGFATALGSALLVVAAVMLLARATRIEARSEVVQPFLAGFAPTEHALSRFHARWYPLALVFLAFDVEMLFMYPWATVAAEIGASAIVEMFVFLGVLMGAVVWAWREGALRWV